MNTIEFFVAFLLLAVVVTVILLLERPPDTAASQSPWAFIRRLAVPGRRGVYLDRLRIIQTPWFAIWLHRLGEPDRDRHLHDHPRPFVSLVLRGGYVEELPWPSTLSGTCGGYTSHVRWLNIKRATDLHRIVSLDRTPTWTLVFCGPLRRRWGFVTEDGWVDHEAYFSRRIAT